MAKHAFILFTSKTLADGAHPIMLRMYINQKRSYYGTGLSAMEDEWDKKQERFISKKYKTQNEVLERIRLNVSDILLHLRMNKIPITKTSFEQKFKNQDKNADVFTFFDKKIEQLKTAGKIGNMNAYINSKAALKSYVNKDTLLFSDVTPSFLTDFETYMLGKGCKSGGLAAYLRSFRALFNAAIQQGNTTRESYPFKNQFNANGYDMAKLKSGYNPRAMSENDIEKFKSFSFIEYPELEDSYKMALFIYYARGINFADIAHLKWSDIYSNRINYIRQKTHKSFTIKISDILADILNHFKGTHEEYVFPIFNDFHKTETQKYNRLKKARANFNKNLKRIGKILEIEVELTSYVLRHSFATTLKRKGGSIALISEAMGHQNVEITNAYLKSFGNDEVDALDDLL